MPARLISNLSARGITEPFPIQVKTLPETMAGRDVLGRGKTGSGKTLAFSIPLVTQLESTKRRPSTPTGLVLAPTRELATQISATLEPLAASYGLKVTTIFGGVSQSRQESALKGGVDIVVACPGRLEDLMRQRLISLDAVQITVLDEADHMADLGFLPGVTRILTATPSSGQRMLFSATLDNGVDKLVKRFLRNHVYAFRRRDQRAEPGDDPPRLPRRQRRRENRIGAPPGVWHRSANPVHAHQASGPQAGPSAHRSRCALS